MVKPHVSFSHPLGIHGKEESIFPVQGGIDTLFHGEESFEGFQWDGAATRPCGPLLREIRLCIQEWGWFPKGLPLLLHPMVKCGYTLQRSISLQSFLLFFYPPGIFPGH